MLFFMDYLWDWCLFSVILLSRLFIMSLYSLDYRCHFSTFVCGI